MIFTSLSYSLSRCHLPTGLTSFNCTGVGDGDLTCSGKIKVRDVLIEGTSTTVADSVAEVATLRQDMAAVKAFVGMMPPPAAPAPSSPPIAPPPSSPPACAILSLTLGGNCSSIDVSNGFAFRLNNENVGLLFEKKGFGDEYNAPGQIKPRNMCLLALYGNRMPDEMLLPTIESHASGLASVRSTQGQYWWESCAINQATSYSCTSDAVMKHCTNYGLLQSNETWNETFSSGASCYSASDEDNNPTTLECFFSPPVPCPVAFTGDCGGNDSGNHGRYSSIDACRQVCADTAGCAYYVWREAATGTNCWPKSACNSQSGAVTDNGGTIQAYYLTC